MLDGAKILRETWGNNTLTPLYDNEDSVCGIIYNDEPYYFQKNLPGDIIGMVDKDSTVVARYSYDAWGVPTIAQDSTDCAIATINPFRYRGYYFDQGTNLYYLQSRYYDPEIGSFIYGDALEYLGSGENLSAYNLFHYCENEPICRFDPFGNAVSYIYGKDQKEAAKVNIKLLKTKYTVYSYYVKSNSDFQNFWNKKGKKNGKLAKMDIVIINLHGNPYGVQYVNFDKLVHRKIDALLLLSCNAGHLDYIGTNPATKFYVKNSIKKLVCCDGTHYRTIKTYKFPSLMYIFNHAIRPYDRTYKQYFEQKLVEHEVVNDDVFRAWCPSIRCMQGFVLYTGKRGGKITGYESLGYKFLSIMQLLTRIGK